MPRVAITDSSPDWKPRLNIEITKEQYWGLKNNIDHGLQKLVFSIIVDDVVKMLELYHQDFIAAAFSRKLTFAECMKEFMSRTPLERKEDGKVK